LREAALETVTQRPDELITVGLDADGNPRRVTLREYLDEALLDARDAHEDAELVRAAAKCLIGA
jgi:hypothetical protein